MKRVVVLLALVAVLVPIGALAQNSCEKAEKYHWLSAYWNTQCLWDLLTGWI